MLKQFENLIIYGAYERSITSLALKEGLMSCFGAEGKKLSPSDIFSDPELSLLYRRSTYRSTVLQMLFLYDKITLVDSDSSIDKSPFENTGYLNLCESDKEPKLLGFRDFDESETAYAQYLKPFVLERLINQTTLEQKFEMKEDGLSVRQFLSTFYDYLFNENHENLEVEKLQKTLKYSDRPASHETYSSIESIGSNKSYWIWVIRMEVSVLMSLLEMSSFRVGTLFQKEFSTLEQNIGVAENLDNADKSKKAYAILKTNYAKAFEKLPYFQNLKEVLSIKDKKSKDIRRMQSVISEVQFALEESDEKAAIAAWKSIRLASRDLNRGLATARVEKWITWVSLPTAIVEFCLGIPSYVGIPLATLGSITTLNTTTQMNKNQWVQLLR